MKKKQIKYGIQVHNSNIDLKNGKTYWAFADILKEHIELAAGETWNLVKNKKGEFSTTDINLAFRYLNILDDDQTENDEERLKVKVRK